MHAIRRRAAVVCGVLAFASAAVPAAHATPVHQVAAGESLWSIAAANGMSPAQLAAANGLSAGASVQTGQVLSIPPRGAAPAGAPAAAPTTATATTTTTATASAPAAGSGAPAGGYVVQAGDTLSAIAARQGVSVTRLAAANGLNAAALLPAGARLYLPAGGSSGPAAATTTATTAAATTPTAGTTTAAQPATTTSKLVATPGRVDAAQIGAIASENGVPPALARAIAWQESGFNNAAISSVGARGVMQVMPGTWQWIGSNLASRPLDPTSATDNVRAGTLYLKHLLRQTGGDQNLAAAGYYQGLASVRGRGMYDDTKQYVNSVAALRSRFGG
ncbi:LysM peptidoglycan-binding domain-containing protein [Patulibacter defluvii]|uniref:LysM peptidoglycan-binding domain-containing protein n=1 Tax=Patulibacter defluvii TaxID=3095358 RepID=UPI002A760FB0|nr:LysM peptidoglycan-binding domain-containing protein [Patulibacter sp. DM4]